jgi:hypothetical protein
MGGYVYRLFLEDGSDVGTFTTSAWDWKPGDEFWDGDHRRWRVLDVAPADADVVRGMFKVEAVRAKRLARRPP